MAHRTTVSRRIIANRRHGDFAWRCATHPPWPSTRQLSGDIPSGRVLVYECSPHDVPAKAIRESVQNYSFIRNDKSCLSRPSRLFFESVLKPEGARSTFLRRRVGKADRSSQKSGPKTTRSVTLFPRGYSSNPSSNRKVPLRWTISPSTSMNESSLISTMMSTWTALSFGSSSSGTQIS